MPQKKKNKPIIVNDKNDPRLQSYKDSLDLFNAYKFQENLTGNKLNIPKKFLSLPTHYDSEIGDATGKKSALRPDEYNPLIPALFRKSFTMDEERAWERKNKKPLPNEADMTTEDLQVLDYIKSLNNPNIYTINRQSPEFYHEKISPSEYYFSDGKKYNKNDYFYDIRDYGPLNQKYEEPVQPIIYQEKQTALPTITTKSKKK